MSTEVTQTFLILEAIKTNNEDVLKKLYLANFKKVEYFILTNNGNTEIAKDIYQEAFISMWRNVQMDKYHHVSDASLSNYILAIAKNKWMDYLRSSNVRKTISLDFFDEHMMTIEASDDIKIERIGLISEKFKFIGDKCKELLKRFYYDNEPLKAIATAFNWTEATVKNNKYRCMEKLRKLINVEDYERKRH